MARGREWYTLWIKTLVGCSRQWCGAEDGTFGHAVQAAQITSLRDTDAQIVMLTIVFVRQEVGEGFCLLEGLSSARQGGVILLQ